MALSTLYLGNYSGIVVHSGYAGFLVSTVGLHTRVPRRGENFRDRTEVLWGYIDYIGPFNSIKGLYRGYMLCRDYSRNNGRQNGKIFRVYRGI